MFIPWAVATLLALHVLRLCYKLLKNIRLARASGLKFVVVPIYPYNSLVLLSLRPFFRFLDKKWPNPPPTSWRRLIGSGWLWSCRHATFVELGTDNFLVVAPGGIVMYTADADVVAQVIARDSDFPKAVALSKPIDLYGPNVLSSEGNAWRRQRKITGQAFSEKNNELVWKETLLQSQAMVTSWSTETGTAKRTITSLAGDTMRLSLSVLSRVMLGRSMDWSWGNDYGNGAAEKEKSASHKMSFTASLQILLGHIFYVAVIPKWILKNVPHKTLKTCYDASQELGLYLQEMVSAKRDAIENKENKEPPTKDFLSNLIRSRTDSNNEKSSNFLESISLSESEVIGNLFVFFIAGQETSANSIHFILLLLAIHPNIQRKVQEDLDFLLAGRSAADWNYKIDFPRLLNSMLGAVFSEQLRLITPIGSIPKRVDSQPQPLTVDNHKVFVPPNSIVRLCVQALHRNPKFWPTSPPKDSRKPYFPPSNTDNDLEEFKPERWLNHDGSASPSSPTPVSSPTGYSAWAANKLYHPPRGAYLPFSAGQRACIGQRFAQVEVMCALAVILSQYSVELAVDAFATDEEVDQMDDSKKAGVWRQARDAADKVWQQKMGCVLTFQIRGRCVPVRIVKRGTERFGGVE